MSVPRYATSRSHGRTAYVLALCGLLMALAVAPALANTPEPDFYRLTEDYVSPHIAWAKPLAGGPVKVLFIVPRGAAREVIEVAERLEMDYTVVMTLSDTELGWTSASSGYALADGISYEDMVRETEEALKGDYDVIVTGRLKWDMFPESILYTIMQKVHDGTGLVHSYAAYGQNRWIKELFAKPLVEEPFVTAGVPREALPVWRDLPAERLVELRSFHEGRMALLYHGTKLPRFMFLTPTPEDTDRSWRELHYEYYMSLAVKAILWAAGREPATTFTGIACGDGAAGDGTISRADLPRTRLIASLGGPTAGLTARMDLRDEDKRSFPSATVKVIGPELAFDLPMLPAGRYFADVTLLSGQKVVNWASAAFEVVAAPGIESVAVDRDSVQPGDDVTATVALTGPARAGQEIVLTVTDNSGRVIARKYRSLVAGETSADLSFRVSNPLALSAEVMAELREGEQVTARGAADLYVPIQRARADFTHCMWSCNGNSNEFVRRIMLRHLRERGIETMTNSTLNPEVQEFGARNNFEAIPYMTRYSYSERELVRTPCLTDPAFLGPHLEKLTADAEALRSYGVRAYTLGDECFLGRRGADICFSDTCVADLREWVKGQYESIEDLNASWGTNYADFDQVEPIELQGAHDLNQPAHWVDHRRHMEFIYARMMDRATDAIHQSDPGGQVGFDGPFTTDSYSGNDWWRLMQTFDMMTLYEREEEWEAVRSFARPGALLGLWYGGYFNDRPEDRERLWPWRGLLNGFNSMWWYACYHGLSTCPMDAVTPSMTIYDPFRWATDEVNEIRGGIGRALLGSERLNDSIATHYSQASVHACTWDPAFGNLDVIWKSLYQTLEDLGVQWNCYSYAQLEGQGLSPSDYRVFIMPCLMAISAEEAAAVRRYVQAGGLVIADVRPAVCDEHGKPLQPGQLDDLFGIDRTEGTGLLSDVTGAVDGAFEGLALQATLEGIDVDGDVRVTDGVALGSAGEAPIIILKRTGQGMTCLLNYGFGSVARHRMEPGALEQWRVLNELLALEQVRPECTVTTGDQPLRGVEIVRYQDGPVSYYGFIKHRNDTDEQPVTATIITSQAGHIYDVRAGKYLGEANTWQAEFVPARAKVFARIPYRVTGLKLTVTPGAWEANEREKGVTLACNLSLQTSGGRPGRHWVRVQAFGPDGQERTCYARNVALEGGAAVTYIPLALNDPPGKWRITARDVISGATGEGSFQLRRSG